MGEKIVYLYTFHKNKLRIFESYFDNGPVIHPYGEEELVYIRKKDGTRRIVPKKEGFVHADQLWLSERDDQKAVHCLIDYRQDKTVKLETEIMKLSEEIKALYLLRGGNHEISD